MGNLVSKFVGNKIKKIIILGEEGVGKTTIFGLLNKKYNNKTKRCDSPPGGFNVDVIKEMVVWDLSGKKSFIPFWKCYFNNVDGVIWVVNAKSNNNKEVLSNMTNLMSLAELSNSKILIYINKIDQVEESVSAKLMEEIDLLFKNRPIKIFCTSLESRGSIYEGYNLLCDAINPTKPRRFYYFPI